MKQEEKDRHPIILNHHCVALIKLFCRTDFFEDIGLDELDLYLKHYKNEYEEAAQQFIDQLEGEWCAAFIVPLRNKLQKIIDEDHSCQHNYKLVGRYYKEKTNAERNKKITKKVSRTSKTERKNFRKH